MRRVLPVVSLFVPGFLSLCGCGAPAANTAPETPAVVTVPAAPAPATSRSPALVSEAQSGSDADEPVERALPDGLRIQELVLGIGREVQSDSRVVVHYVGTLDDGTEFDSTRKRGQPVELPLGRGALIKGFEEGVVGMRAGGRRRVLIPFVLGYGERGRPPTIPPRATLVFDVEIVEVK